MRRRRTGHGVRHGGPRRLPNEAAPRATVNLDLKKRLSPLVPAATPSRNSAGVSMAVHPRSKLPRTAKKPIQSGANVGRRPRSRAVFTRRDGLVQQRPDFFANDVARPTGLAPSGAHFLRRCSKEFPFQGVKQRRQSGLRITYAGHGQDQAKLWRSMGRRIRRRVVSYSTAVRL
jgi:hypothetical protein